MSQELLVGLLHIGVRLRIEQCTLGVKIAEVGKVRKRHRATLQRDHAVVSDNNKIDGKMQRSNLRL